MSLELHILVEYTHGVQKEYLVRGQYRSTLHTGGKIAFYSPLSRQGPAAGGRYLSYIPEVLG